MCQKKGNDEYMKKYFPQLMLAILIVMILAPVAGAASPADWSINWRDNGIIQEEVVISDGQITEPLAGWEKEMRDGKTVFSRKVENWQKYNTLEDRLPLQAKYKEKLLFKTVTLQGDPYTPMAGGIYDQLRNSGARVNILAPGTIKEHSADQLVDNEAVWQLSNLKQLADEEIVLQVLVFDGLLIGISIFIFAILLISIIFGKSLRKAAIIIQEEYALENVHLEETAPSEQPEGQPEEEPSSTEK